jgi:hypothetical protein
MHGNRLIAAAFFALAAGCLLLTGWIMHRSGALQGATEDGRWALGLAAIAVHLILAVCGLAMFVSRKIFVSLVCCAMMLGAALCSGWQIATFLATEVISVTKAREAAEKRKDAREAAAVDLAKERQKTQTDLLKDELKWSRGTSREVDGRRERKDLAETRAKLIAEIGKTGPAPLPEIKTETPTLQSGLLAQWLAARTGWDETALQASPYLLIAFMLLMSEVVFWPLASFFWNRPAHAGGLLIAEPPKPVETDPRHAPAALPGEPMKALPPPRRTAVAALLEEKAAQDAGVTPGSENLVQPEPPARIHPAKAPAPVRIERRPIDEWAAAALRNIDFPLEQPGRRAGPLRGKQNAKTTARRFVLWMQAVGLSGAYSATEVATHYREFSEWDYREPIAYRDLASGLPKAQGVSKTNPVVDGKQQLRWVIGRRQFKPRGGVRLEPQAEPETNAAQQLADAAQEMHATENAPAAEGRARGPFVSSGAARGATRAGLRMQPDWSEPACMRRQAKELRALRIARNRRQRGGLAGWRAA